MATFPTFATRRRSSLLHAGLVLTLLCGILVSAQQVHDVPAQQLYLLSGTPTEHSDKTYPVVLYRASADKKLNPVREVVSRDDGLRFIQAWGDAVFAVHPHILATTVSIIHTLEPMLADDVVFNPRNLILGDDWVAVSEPKALSSVDELVPLLIDASDATHIKGTLASISSSLTARGSRVRFDTWDEYETVRFSGMAGGPAVVAGLAGSIVGHDLVVSLYGHSVVIDSLPLFLLGAKRPSTVGIAALNQEFLVLGVSRRTSTDLFSRSQGDSTELAVHDRVRGTWKTIQIEGNQSTCRLFGSWLATIVKMWNPDHKPSPGRENERNQETDRLPNVRGEYARFGGKWNWSPGVLVLQNLADGRKIRIETGQEDSEILRVEANTALYRINDTIFEAKIVGDQLRDSTVLVKDEDVPEIHWVFWSP